MEGDFKNKGTSKEKLQISLHASLVDVSNTLQTSFFNQIENCILTSATLKVENSFNYFLGRVGLGDFGMYSQKIFLVRLCIMNKLVIFSMEDPRRFQMTRLQFQS